MNPCWYQEKPRELFPKKQRGEGAEKSEDSISFFPHFFGHKDLWLPA